MPGKPPAQPDDIAAIARAMVTIRRRQARRALARAAEYSVPAPGPALPDQVVQLLDAVADADTRGTTLTVTDAADLLGVDQPRASRLAAQALAAGLLRREADQADGRRSLLRLTTAGHTVLTGIDDFRQSVIADATAGWPEADRAALARLLTRFVTDLATTTDRHTHT